MSYLTGQNFRGLRVLVLTGAVTCITIAGTQYGAGLKTEHERSQVLILFPFPFLPSFFFFFFFWPSLYQLLLSITITIT